MRSAFRLVFTVIVFVVQLFAIHNVAFSQDNRIIPVYTDRFPTIEVVLESSSQLAPQNARLLEDGQPTATATSMKTFGQTGRGMAVVFALDVSGSMAGRPLEQMKRALAGFVNQASTQDRIAIVTFADEMKVEADFGSSPQKLQSTIAALKSRGQRTELYKGLLKSLKLFDTAKELPERRILVVISDGHNEGEGYELDDVIKEANQRGVPAQTIGLTQIDPKHLSNLERLADMTGGHYELARSGDDLGRAFNAGLTRLKSTPVAVFTAQRLTADGEQHRLGAQWTDGGNERNGGRLVVLPKKIPPPPPPLPESRWWLWAGLAALGLLLLTAVLLLSRRRKTKPPPVLSVNEPISEQPDKLWTLPSEVISDESNDDPGRISGDEQPELPRPKRRRASTQIREEFPAPRPGRPAATLVCEEGLLVGERMPVETDYFTIGGEEDNMLCLAADGYLSGYHAYIRFDHGSLLLIDRGSTNGTFLNDERLEQEKPRLLNPGDRIKVGHSVFVVERGG